MRLMNVREEGRRLGERMILLPSSLSCLQPTSIITEEHRKEGAYIDGRYLSPAWGHTDKEMGMKYDISLVDARGQL